MRHYLSFHYGPVVRDGQGNIDRSPENPVILRICNTNRPGEPAHLHYKRPHPAPYYTQSQVEGLTLTDVDMFSFVNGVFKSRAETIEMPEAMGFVLR